MSTTSPNGPAPFLTSLNAGLGTDSVVSSETQDQAWPTIPIEDDPTPPDTDGFTLVSDISDFARPLPGLQPVSDDPAGIAQQYGKDMMFDWTTGEPAGLVSGNLRYAIDEDEVLGWCEKGLMTPQGRYPIYAPGYGSDLRSLVGQRLADQILFSEVARTVQECIAAHPRVAAVSVEGVFRAVSISPTGLFVVVSLELDTSEEPIVLTFLTS